MYLSKALRLFQGIENCLKLYLERNEEELLKSYRLYDVLFTAFLVNAFENEEIIHISKRLLDILYEKFDFDTTNLVQLALDIDNKKLNGVKETGEIFPLTTLSSGQQAILVMLLPSILMNYAD